MEHGRQAKRRQKERLYGLFAQVGAALANPHRLELLDLLAQSPRTVEELAGEGHMTLANTSQHLQRLKRVHLVSDERDGVYIRYRLASRAVARLWLELRSVGHQQQAEVERALDAYRTKRHEFETITPDRLVARQKTGEVALLDVRPAPEFQAGHLASAISIPVEGLADRLSEIPRDKTIVAYCRGPYCVDADLALEVLSHNGWNVARLEEGVTEWQQAGYELEGESIKPSEKEVDRISPSDP